MNPGRPHPDEYVLASAAYVARVPDGDIVSILSAQLDLMHTRLAPLSRVQVLARPTPEDWNILEVLGHITDAEQVFTHRAFHIARADAAPLSSFDQDEYVRNAHFADHSLEELLATYTAMRRFSIALFATFDAAAWQRSGIVLGRPTTPRAWAYVAAGHELHHLADFTTRYGLA